MEQSNKIQCYIDVKNENFVLRDHRVHQVRIMPGVTFLDLIYKLLQAKGFNLEQVELRHILFKEAVATTEFYDKKVYISIYHDETTPFWTVVAKSRKVKNGRELEDEWVENLQCELHLIEAKKEQPIDIEELKRSAIEVADLDSVYSLARQLDINHYEFMKGIGTLYKGEQFVLAEVSLSPLSMKYMEQFYLHPAFLDCSTLIPFFHDDNIKISEPFIPLFIKKFRAVNSLGERCYIYINDPARSRLSNDMMTAHYAIYNEEGDMVALFEGFSAKRIRSKEFITKYLDHKREGHMIYKDKRDEVDAISTSLKDKDSEQVMIENDLRKMIATVRDCSIDDVDPKIAFYDQGLDSTELLDLVMKIEEKINCQLYPTLLFEYTNIKTLSDYLMEEYGEQYKSYLENNFENASAKQVHETQSIKQRKKPSQGRTLQSKGSPTQYERSTDIAVIGLSGRYPQSPDLGSFWDNISTGQNCITEVPADHWNVEPDFDPNPSNKNKSYSKWGGFLSDVDKFDPVFFRIAPSEAEKLDPQLRIMLETAWHTVEDAGYTPDKLSKKDVGVYVGVMNNDFTWVASENYIKTGEFSSPGNYNHEIANRISYCLNFSGPSLTLETACSSSLTAIHMARQAIISGECTTALAGGVNLSLHQSKYLMLSGLKILSPDGMERTFDEEANGYVPAEGVGMVLLKSLPQAIADGDHIYGVIKSSSVNHSGSEAGQHVPNVKSLARLAQGCIEKSGVNPEHIGYIESHGTGTSVGDTLELKALETAIRTFTNKKSFCALGSKANFGHLESASGICSLTKVLLSLKHGKIPKCANVNRVNSAISLDDFPFYIPQETEEWESDNHPRVAAINSFGIGGANSFMVVEEFVGETNHVEQNDNMEQHLVVLSARKETNLKQYAQSILEFLDQERENLRGSNANYFLSSMAYTLQTGRQPFQERLAVVVSHPDELKNKLVRYVSGEQQIKNLFSGNVKKGSTKLKSSQWRANVEKTDKLSDWAEKWVAGGEVNWESLYEHPPQKMSLPNYPFDKNSLWIGQVTGLQNGSDNSKDEALFPPSVNSEYLEEVNRVYLHHVWNKRDSILSKHESWHGESILIFDTDEQLRDVLLEKIAREGSKVKVILVKPGDAYRYVSSEVFEIKPNQFSDYEQLITTLKLKNALPSKVLYLWSKDRLNDKNTELDNYLQKGLYSVFPLTQALMKMKLKHTIKLLFVHDEQQKQIDHGALAGLFKTIQIENPRFVYKSVMIDFPLTESEVLIDLFQREYQMSDNAVEVRYTQGERHVRILMQFEPPVDQIQFNMLKDQGVYLITGGLGGLGFIFARYIAEQVHAKLVLVGRSRLNPDKEAKLEQLRSLGTEAVYIQGDITRKESVKELMREVKALYGELHGIIHSAGVTQDRLLIQKEQDEIKKVIAPKVYGSVYLDEATKNEPLDFFVLFSSTAGVMGNTGQSDYAFANSYLDGFAANREEKRHLRKRNGKTVSISWPLWKEGGMNVDEQTKQHFLRKFGMSPMNTKTGLEAFQYSLSNSESHIVVAEGNRQKIIEAIGASDEKTTERSEVTIQTNDREVLNSKEQHVQASQLYKYLYKDVLSIVVDILKINEDEIDMDTELSDFGFDSILLTKFSEHLSDLFHENIYPFIFFEYRTLGSLIDYLANEYRGKMVEHYLVNLKEVQKDSDQQVQSISTEKIVEQSLAVDEKSVEKDKKSTFEPVAIIGMNGTMPQSEDLHCFWENIEQEKDLITEVPEDRWQLKNIDGEQHSFPKWGGFMNEIDKFDPLFFGISPWEAELMDPQQRLFMETVWKTIENAGYKPSDLSGTRTALFVGVATTDYRELYQNNHTEINAQTTTGTSHCILANRISFLLNIHGPSEPIDTACSSSLVAIHRAVEAIQYGQCEMAIAGGVNIIASPNLNVSFHKAGMLATDGRCKTFDNKANGYVRGEGTGALLLKPLRQAEADGDHIYGVIRGTEVNHGGHANSLTSPNPIAQKDLLVGAYRKAGVNPATVGYIEAHGTGTSLGDPIEIEGLKKAFDQLYEDWRISQPPQQYCGLGSVKTNIGHLETAAGIAGVFKVLLGMKHKQIPGTLHFNELNQYIELEGSPFYIVDKTQSWERLKDKYGRQIPRRAGVSSFGFGGVNAHLILEEYEQPEPSVTQNQQPELIVLSAKNKERLAEYANKLRLDIERKKEQNINLSAMAYTLQIGREPMDERLAMVVSSVQELKAILTDFQQDKENVNALYEENAPDSKLKYLLSGGAGNEFIRRLVKEKEYEKLARLWLSGLEIDWNLLHTENNRRRLPLPTYPFARERYWIPSPVLSKKKKDNTVLHPLLDTIDMKKSLGSGIVLRKHFKRLDQIVQEHKVNNKPTLPGVGYLEMVYAAASEITSDSPQSISDVYWLQPLIVEDEKAVSIVISNEEDQLHYEVVSEEQGDTIIHGKGRIDLSATASKEEEISITNIKTRCTEKIYPTKLYNALAEVGLVYGSSFQGIQEVWKGSDEALSYIELPESCLKENSSYTMHPMLMDAALQTLTCLDMASVEKGTLKIPFATSRIEVLRPLESKVYTHVRMLDEDRFDLTITDVQGVVCIRLFDFIVKEVKESDKNLLYATEWEAEPVFFERNKQDAGSALIVHTDQGMGLVNTLCDKHQEVFCIRLGSETRQVDPYNWEVQSNKEDSFDSIIQKLPKIDALYYLGGIQHSIDSMYHFKKGDGDHEQVVLSLFRLIKTLQRTKYLADPLEIKVITNNVHQVMNEYLAYPQAASLFGFAKSLAIEHQNWSISCIDVDLYSEEEQAIAESIMEESGSLAGSAVAIRNGVRYVQRIKPLQLPNAKEIPFRQNGVYVILGGTGGIGLELSRYLAKSVQAKLVLLGRKPLTAKQKEQIMHIESMGAEVLHIEADASDYSSMEQAINRVKETFGIIHGAFHSAMVLNDKMLVNMNEDTLLSVLAPKISGSVNFYEALKDQPLDFMMFFSSAISFLDSAGQSNYAAASTFQDAWARYLHKNAPFPIKLINWGYWGETGVVATEEYNKRMATRGIKSIQPEEGIEVIQQILLSQVTQVMPFKASNNFLRQMGVQLQKCDRIYSKEIPSLIETTVQAVEKEGLDSSNATSHTEALKKLKLFARYLLLSAFQQMGVFKRSKESYNIEDLKEKMQIVPAYSGLFEALVNILEESGFIQTNSHQVTTTQYLESRELQHQMKEISQYKDDLLYHYPNLEPYVKLIWVCVNSYPSVLTGKRSHMEVLFPLGSADQVKNIYGGNDSADYHNSLVAQFIKNYIKQRLKKSTKKKLNILEVGAGTGATSHLVLKAIKEYAPYIHYFYTDISQGFTKQAEKVYGEHHPFVEFKVLDIEKDLAQQGFQMNSIDIVLGSNVLHATKNIKNTLERIKILLKTNGITVINEVTQIQEFLTLTFGLTEGWWLFEDPEYRLPHSPLLNTDKWQSLLALTGYKRTKFLDLPTQSDQDKNQSIIIAESDGRVSTTVTIEPDPPNEDQVDMEKESTLSSPKKNMAQDLSHFELQSKTIDYLKEQFANVLKINKDRIDHKATFEIYGVDSLVMVRLISHLEKEFGKLPSTLLFEHMTIEKLSEYFMVKHPDHLNKLFTPLSVELMEEQSYQSHYEDVVAASKETQPFATEHLQTEEMENIVDRLSDEEVDKLFNKIAGLI
ncbi:SDR family NAD(P)-dependent oxidoreductase [Gracilibacillus sp. S3-1-1]|uniref:SDR family NAD(P)-dependent oxidoreductase n=1 Tax=Gracilibacillus pellucidus TaxID=3095368 RepID=A0ACC6M8D7_9BACI|nr:SDR family NAD(P)-dependent oxidoreductase [Gracilibacillus sp. S3-1-1]MDX8047241.1 SDR family NAD(P)-dependent oxidoreductase [Gracilibacillus sp. S3-1-1]